MIYVSEDIKENMTKNMKFIEEFTVAIDKYNHQDWGDISEEEKQRSDLAYKYGNDRILGGYNTSKGKVYIIIDADKNTTVTLSN